jgi:hypothetical protein
MRRRGGSAAAPRGAGGWGERGRVGGDDAAPRRREGTLHVVEEEDDDIFADGELAVGEELEQHRADQGVIGRRHRDIRHGDQARAQIGQRRLPARRRLLRGQQEMQAALGGKIDEVKQRPLGRLLGTVDHHRPGSELGHRARRKRRGRAEKRSRAGLPDMGEMRFPAAGRTVQRQRGGRPIRPAVEPGDRRRIARGDEEVIGAEGRPMGELKGELGRHHAPARPADRKSGCRDSGRGQSASARR